MPTYRLTVEYDGTDFHGWQAQPQARTVAGTLLDAVHQLTGQHAQLSAAGRTDAGAHAHGQVAGIVLEQEWDPVRLQAGLNALLPADVVVVDVEVDGVSVDGGGASIDGAVITVRANAFLRGMMRAFASVLVAVGQGRHAPDWVHE